MCLAFGECSSGSFGCCLWFQGADEEAEKLCLSNELFDAAAQQDPLLVKRDLGWVWIDLEVSWAGATDSDASFSCKKDWACLGGTRWDFILGCPTGGYCIALVLG